MKELAIKKTNGKEGFMNDEISFEYFIKELLNQNNSISLLTVDSLSIHIVYQLFENYKDYNYKREYLFIDNKKIDIFKNDVSVYKTNLGFLIDVKTNKELKEKIENFAYFKLKYNITLNEHKIENDFKTINALKSLVSLSDIYSQNNLDNMCINIVNKLYQRNKSIISKEKEIYESIKRKLLTNRKFTNEEKELLNNFLKTEEILIEKDNTLLKRSLE